MFKPHLKWPTVPQSTVCFIQHFDPVLTFGFFKCWVSDVGGYLNLTNVEQTTAVNLKQQETKCPCRVTGSQVFLTVFQMFHDHLLSGPHVKLNRYESNVLCVCVCVMRVFKNKGLNDWM